MNTSIIIWALSISLWNSESNKLETISIDFDSQYECEEFKSKLEIPYQADKDTIFCQQIEEEEI